MTFLGPPLHVQIFSIYCLRESDLLRNPPKYMVITSYTCIWKFWNSFDVRIQNTAKMRKNLGNKCFKRKAMWSVLKGKQCEDSKRLKWVHRNFWRIPVLLKILNWDCTSFNKENFRSIKKLVLSYQVRENMSKWCEVARIYLQNGNNIEWSWPSCMKCPEASGISKFYVLYWQTEY